MLSELHSWIEATWLWAMEYFTPFQLLGVAPFVVTVGTYWLVGLLFLIVDLSHSPSFIYQFTVQPKRPFKREHLKKLVLNVLMNQFLVLLPVSLLMGWVGEIKPNLGYRMTPSLPSLFEVTNHLIYLDDRDCWWY